MDIFLSQFGFQMGTFRLQNVIVLSLTDSTQDSIETRSCGNGKSKNDLLKEQDLNISETTGKPTEKSEILLLENRKRLLLEDVKNTYTTQEKIK